jgi:hypothetical protein
MTSAVDLRRWFLLQNPLADNRPGVLYFVRAGSFPLAAAAAQASSPEAVRYSRARGESERW